MPYTRNAAKKLLNVSELEMFDVSRRGLGTLGKSQVRAKVKHTRRLRDKYRDLYRRQRRSTRGRTGSKPGPRGKANLRTKEKEELFGEMLVRFQKRLDQIETAERQSEPAAAKSAHSKRKKKTKRLVKKRAMAAGPKARTGFMSAAAKSADTRRQLHKSRGVAIQAHLRSRGRRHQAKRDRRG